MKKDAVIAIAIIIVVAGICYGLSVIKLDLPPLASAPYSTAPVGAQVTGHVIFRVNGEPVTEEEFDAAFAQLPEEQQRQLANPAGKSAFAEQYIRYKLLEQEAQRLGLDRDPKVAGVISSERMNILASAAAQKLVVQPTEQAIRSYYDSNKDAFQSVDVSHILVAYAGGMAPARPGHTAAPQAQAMAMAQAIVRQIRAGTNFAQMAIQYSDDVGSIERGGDIGTFARGQLPPELDGRVFALRDGQVSDPFPSRIGVHIFLVRKHGTMPMERVHNGIAQKVRNQNMLDRIEVLRKAAKIDFDPKFFPDQRPATPKKPS